MSGERPTAVEKADAADRLYETIESVIAEIHDAYRILREGRAAGQTHGHRLFPFIGDQIEGHLEAARDALWAAEKLVAEQGYTERRAANREATP